MMDLRRYRPEQITAAGQAHAAYATSAETSSQEAIALLKESLFRDPSGQYWAVDHLGQRWYRWEHNAWQIATAPEGPLEGPAALDMPTEPSTEITLADDDLPVATSAVEAVAALVQRLGSAYCEGRLCSSYAHELLGRIVLVSSEGRAMTVGVASGQWYVFQGGAWSPNATLPSDDALLTRSELSSWIQGNDGLGVDGHPSAEVAESIAAFLVLGAGTLPEPVTEPWDPPAEEPPIWPRCPACQRVNLPGYRHCTWCGQAAPPIADGSPAPPGEPSATGTLACPACGSPCRPTQSFCEKCGASLVSVTPRNCPRCSAPVKATDRFCAKCGAPIA